MAESLRRWIAKTPDLTAEEWAERDRAAAEREREQRRRAHAQAVAKGGIPLGYRMASMTDERVREWAASPTVGLLLKGKPGRGKTHNGCAALVELARSRTVRFATAKGMLDEVKATFDTRDSERAVVSRLCNVGVLMLDDLGAERLTEWSLPIVFEVIDRRQAEMRPTIVTTNYDGLQLIDKMTVKGDEARARAIISRLGAYRLVTMDGPDRRLL